MLCLDCQGFGPPVSAPYSIVLDGRVVAMNLSASDSARGENAWARINMATVKSIEILRGPSAREQYPQARGDVSRVSRCY